MKNFILFSFLSLLLLFVLGCEKQELTKFEFEDQFERERLQINAGNAIKPFKGYYKGKPISPEGCDIKEGVNPVHFLFSGNATHVGKSTWKACQYNVITGVDPETGYLQFGSGGIQSEFVITAANGDFFTGYYDDFAGELREDGNIYFWGTFIVTPEDNTGIFKCVTGELPLSGQTHPDDNFFTSKADI